MKVTRDPADTVTVRGDVPLDVIVIVAALVPPVAVGEVGVGLPEPPPPHAATTNVPSADAATRLEIRPQPVCTTAPPYNAIPTVNAAA
jgi:hypothetical protein